MNTGLLFPGQGSQRPQMLHNLVRHPAVDETLAEISEVLGTDVRMLDSTDALRSPVSVQVAIFAAGVSIARPLQRSGVQPLAVVVLSIGAFSAAVVAEAIELSDAVRLVLAGQEVINFLERCEAGGITLMNCATYVREWITRQRRGR